MRVTQQTAYVLHTRAFSETSLLVELLTHSQGRLSVLAKGARRLKSPFRGVLQPFQALVTGWSGKGELPVLTQAELQGRYHCLDYKSRVCGFYANELLMSLLQRRDPHQQLFSEYHSLMSALSENTQRELALRSFEKSLLQEIGYGLILTHEVEQQKPIESEQWYRYFPETGPILETAQMSHESNWQSPLLVSGRVLKSIECNDYPDDNVMVEAKRFMRRILQLMVVGKPLHSRNLLYHTVH